MEGKGQLGVVSCTRQDKSRIRLLDEIVDHLYAHCRGCDIDIRDRADGHCFMRITAAGCFDKMHVQIQVSMTWKAICESLLQMLPSLFSSSPEY